MKRNIAVTKIAAIALALSAFASPLAANAATGPLTDFYAAALKQADEGSAPGKNAAAVVSVVAFHPADPLQLAAQYAPDTVQEWKATLAEFETVMKAKYGDLSASASASAVLLPADGKPVIVASGQVSAVALTTAETADGKLVTIRSLDGQAQLVPAMPLDEPKQPAVVKVEAIPASKHDRAVLNDASSAASATTAASVKAVTDVKTIANVKTVASVMGAASVKAVASVAPATIADGVTVETAGKTAAGGQSASASLTDGAMLTIVQDGAKLDPFFASQAALDQAVHAKDAAAIKDALAKLLTQYHSRIDELRKAE